MREIALQALSRWCRWAENYWWDSPDRPGLGCFGPGYDQWGVQTNQKYVGACAVLAAEPDPDPSACGMSREELLEAVWGYGDGTALDTRSVDSCVARLRRKLEPDPDNPRYITTRRGAGHMLEAE